MATLDTESSRLPITQLDIAWERDLFLRNLIRQLSSALEGVLGRSPMCMMTSNVFGIIASQSLGYGKVSLEETIIRADSGCRVVVHPQPNAESEAAPGQEYFQS